jgi:ribonucleoside-diphosphate reductase beta chain
MQASGILPFTGLYRKWENQQWKATAIDLSQDADDWLRATAEERWQWFWLASFAHFRQSETDAVVWLSRVLPCLLNPDEQYLLAAQIADEGRHAVFFERFSREVLQQALPDGEVTLSPSYRMLFIETPTLVADNLAKDRSAASLAVAVFHVFILLEGAIALASFSVIRRLLIKTGRFPGLLKALTLAQRDEVRHAELGLAILLRLFEERTSCREAVRLHLHEHLSTFSSVLEPRPERRRILEDFGLDPLERRNKAFTLLRRNAGALGLSIRDIKRASDMHRAAEPLEIV